MFCKFVMKKVMRPIKDHEIRYGSLTQKIMNQDNSVSKIEENS